MIVASPPHRRRTLLLALLVLLLPALTARGQADAVSVEVDRFGLGGLYRPGDVCPIRLRLLADPQSNLDPAVNVVVQIEIPNADGDVAEYRRPTALTKGSPKLLWLYAPLPETADQGTVLPVRVFLFEGEERGREIGGGRIQPPARAAQPTEGFIAVVGARDPGLDGYVVRGSARTTIIPTAHESVALARGLRTTDLPDHWWGYRAFDLVAWTDAAPGDLNSRQSDALARWIRGGGHLVVVLPEDGNPWGLGDVPANDLAADLLPAQRPRYDEGTPLAELLPLLSKSRGLDDATAERTRVGIHVFADAAAGFAGIDAPWAPLLALADGRVVAIQRSFGHGRITLIGLDLADPRYGGTIANGLRERLPEADALWNRVLGRRQDTPGTAELDAIEQADRLRRSSVNPIAIGQPLLIQEEIKHREQAGKGLATALLLFIAYWLLAGPVGFGVLRHRGLVRHAWLAFAGAALVFTGLAWASVQVLRENEIRMRHLTVIDLVGGPETPGDPQLARAVAWMSLYLPGYGTVGLDFQPPEDPDYDDYRRELLLSWAAGAEQTFPNVTRYAVNVGDAGIAQRIPKRSTATHLKAEWLGPAGTEFGGISVDPDDPVRVVVEGGRERLAGTIRSVLPAALENVSLTWIRSRRIPTRSFASDGGRELPWRRSIDSGTMPNVGDTWRLDQAWEPGAPLRLDVPQGSTLTTNLLRRYYEPFRDGIGGFTPTTIAPAQRREFLEMLGLFQMLPPPPYLQEPGVVTDEDRMRANREIGRELDLSAWYVRPCLLVTGFLPESACPIPLRAEGRPVRSEGLTMVRWILPLPLIPEVAFPLVPEAADADGAE